MLKWLGLSLLPRDVQIDQRTEEEWRRADQPSLFLVVTHHRVADVADWRTSLRTSTCNSLTEAGFADGWSSPLRSGPRRHPLLDGGTVSEFVTLNRAMSLRHLAQVEVKETYAWDWHYRSEIYATGISFSLSFQDQAMDRLIEKLRVGESPWMGDSILCSFAVRVPVRRQIAFPEPRATEKPYSDGPLPRPLRNVAKINAGWIEVAALDSKRVLHKPVQELPLCELFANAGPVRLSLGEK